jgi:hypothetical protein
MRMKRRANRSQIAAVIAAASTATALILSPPAMALPFSNCDQAEAAGAAPIYAGQPGYSPKLDRDGDGVACEQGGGGPVTAASPPIPYAATTYTTLIAWDETPCIDVIWPNNNQMLQQNFCHQPEELKLIFHTAAPGPVDRRRSDHGRGELDRLLGDARLRQNSSRQKQCRCR